jgi:osmotically inducible lipoprotein OsmB
MRVSVRSTVSCASPRKHILAQTHPQQDVADVREKTQMHRLPIVPTALLSAIALSGCADMSATQQRTLTGSMGGAAGGALIGAIAGNAGVGALIGAGAGAAGGYLYDRSKQNEQRAYQSGYQQGQQR